MNYLEKQLIDSVVNSPLYFLQQYSSISAKILIDFHSSHSLIG